MIREREEDLIEWTGYSIFKKTEVPEAASQRPLRIYRPASHRCHLTNYLQTSVVDALSAAGELKKGQIDS